MREDCGFDLICGSDPGRSASASAVVVVAAVVVTVVVGEESEADGGR